MVEMALKHLYSGRGIFVLSPTHFPVCSDFEPWLKRNCSGLKGETENYCDLWVTVEEGWIHIITKP